MVIVSSKPQNGKQPECENGRSVGLGSGLNWIRDNIKITPLETRADWAETTGRCSSVYTMTRFTSQPVWFSQQPVNAGRLVGRLHSAQADWGSAGLLSAMKRILRAWDEYSARVNTRASADDDAMAGELAPSEKFTSLLLGGLACHTDRNEIRYWRDHCHGLGFYWFYARYVAGIQGFADGVNVILNFCCVGFYIQLGLHCFSNALGLSNQPKYSFFQLIQSISCSSHASRRRDLFQLK